MCGSPVAIWGKSSLLPPYSYKFLCGFNLCTAKKSVIGADLFLRMRHFQKNLFIKVAMIFNDKPCSWMVFFESFKKQAKLIFVQYHLHIIPVLIFAYYSNKKFCAECANISRHKNLYDGINFVLIIYLCHVVFYQ